MVGALPGDEKPPGRRGRDRGILATAASSWRPVVVVLTWNSPRATAAVSDTTTRAHAAANDQRMPNRGIGRPRGGCQRKNARSGRSFDGQAARRERGAERRAH